jgi:hypothetical protein
MDYDKGFLVNGVPLKNDKGETLLEWFFFDLFTRLTIPANSIIPNPRKVQLAILSDDGSQVFSYLPDGTKQLLIDNNKPNSSGWDYVHPPKLECTENAIIADGSPISINIQYSQGPRHSVALALFYREASFDSNGNEIKSARCGQTMGGTPAQVKSATDDFLANPDGWKIIPKESYSDPI